MAEDRVALTPWHLRDPQAYARTREELLTEFPTLHLEAISDGEELRGTFVVRDGEGALGSFTIRAHLPAEFPDRLPSFSETSRTVPHRPERHVNGDGTLCIMLPDEYWVEHDHCDLLAYLRGPVHDYFLGQVCFEHTGEWPGGEMPHNTQGRLQYYQELLGTSEPLALLRLCDDLTAPRLHRQELCPCGSKRKRRRCHGPQIVRLRGKVSSSDIALVREQLR